MFEENFCIKRIRELMEKNGYNTYRLAKQSGISLSTLSSMFEHNTEPRIETLEKICSACNISVAQFFERSSRDLSSEQSKVLDLYDSLSPKSKDMALSYLCFLSENE